MAIKQNSSELNGPIDVRIDKVSRPSGPIDVRIFAVSRRVHAEALEVFYQVNTFAVWIQEPAPLPLCSQANRQTSTTSYGPDPKNAHLDPLSRAAR